MCLDFLKISLAGIICLVLVSNQKNIIDKYYFTCTTKGVRCYPKFYDFMRHVGLKRIIAVTNIKEAIKNHVMV